MRVQISVLSQEEKEQIHCRALDVLETVGVKFNSHQALDVLEAGGCLVDREELSARIPSHVVEQGLNTVPRQVRCAGTDPRWDLLYGSGDLYCVTAACPVYIRDLQTRERRPATLADLIDVTRLIDAMDAIDEDCPGMVPNDVDPRLRNLRMLQVHLAHSRKHYAKSVLPWEVPFFLEMMDAVLGDRARLRERPIFSCTYDDIEPLQKDGRYIEGCLALGEYNVPVLPFQMLIAGATTPITLAGSVVMMTANFLSTLVLYQLHTPGRGVIWGGAPTVLDMRAGLAYCEVESALMSAAHVEMAKFYNIPCLGFGTYTGAKAIGFQAGLDMALALAVPVLAGADAVYGTASFDTMNLADLPAFVMGADALRQVKRLRQGMKVDEEHLAFDAIGRMRYKADYLSDPTTKRFYRDEVLLDRHFPRESYDTWQARRESEEDAAITRVRELLNMERPAPVAREVGQELEQIISVVARSLA
jgi:trimethylamine--corrinoid protein Co-methyltransferase